jgi:hypothetical protein
VVFVGKESTKVLNKNKEKEKEKATALIFNSI